MTKETTNEIWPISKFHFIVNIDGIECAFQEVSGLETETQVIEYRKGNNKQFSTIKMPGIAKYGNITLKRGLIPNDNDFLIWYSAIKMNTIKRSTVIIKLLNEVSKPVMTWTLQNAWPTKITSTDLKSDGKGIAVETLELAYEGITIET